ncbi:uncharacterized protein LOC114014560 isoform X2 [Falco cherrug]|uniref:uncharacterized protein LOC114014560 isoform X2 n=1 Tax=Falco cherrug TaxID=345164 RepID=UPI00247A68D6|nr:uncharacterized protein LOC114014560 isoform X2 [Falco cherrug]
MSAKSICSIPGTLPAPVLSLSTSSTHEGDLVSLWCFVNQQSDATRVVFCKDGMEKYSLRADWGQLMYVMELNVTLESAGWYTCGYQHKDEKNWVRSSALSVPRHVAVTGSESSTQRAPTAPDPLLHRDLGIGLGLAAASVLLLAAVNCWILKRVGCRERCRRQQRVPSHEAEASNDNEIQYVSVAYIGRHRPLVQAMNTTSTYATVTRSSGQPR